MKCKSIKCKTCPAVYDAENVGNFFNEPICKISGVVYMISCGKCNVKYIGQTGTPLNLRINNHRSLCNKNKCDSTDVQSKYEFEHFKIHSFNDIRIDILHFIKDRYKRLEVENMCIVKYKTAYPYGLNDRINKISVTAIKDKICIYKDMFDNSKNLIDKPIRIRSLNINKNKSNAFIDFDSFVVDLDDAVFNKKNVIGYVKNKILGLKRSKAKVLTKHVSKYKFKYNLMQDLIIDLLKYKLKRNNWLLEDDVNSKFDSFLIIDFEHKYIDSINIPQILHSHDLMSSFPVSNTYPKVSYKYSQTLGSIVFNYVKFTKELSFENVDNYYCACDNSIFKDEFHGHIITGNLNILQDNELINIFKFGSKFRLIPNLDLNKLNNTIVNRVTEYVYKMSFKLNVNVGEFSEWKVKLITDIQSKINSTPNTFSSTVNIRSFRNKIKDFQNQYVIVPVDKANSNFGFICKKFYAQILSAEINVNDTFEVHNKNLTDVKKTFTNFYKKFGITPQYNNIPFMYAIPKFHKNPVKFRFITSSVNCINRDANVILNLILDKLNDKLGRESEHNWIIKDNSKIIESVALCNESPVGPGNFMLSTYDFSTLYTTLPHYDLIRCIVALYNKCFDSNIDIYYKYKKITISKINFVDILKFCINNNFILLNDNIFRQKVGIPMGANYSPNMANLYLHFYEDKFLSMNHMGGRLGYNLTFRFIDDLISFNNRNILFDIRTIYPRELEISNTNVVPHNAGSFLDIDIKVNNNRFVTKIYDKRRDFNFDILGLPAFLSNIPSNMVFGVICSQFCRFAFACMKGCDFVYNCQLFVDKLRHNGFPPWLLKKLVSKFENKKARSLSKFNFNRELKYYVNFN